MPPNPAEFALITRRYCDLGNTEEINYYWFCRDIDHKDDIFPAYQAKHPQAEAEYKTGMHVGQTSSFFNRQTADLDVVNNRFMEPKVEISNDPSDVEDRIRSMVVMKRMRIEEFFRDYDKLRKGRITRQEFKRVLACFNFVYTEDELEALCNKYKTNDPEVFFDYPAFVASINKAFTITGIDKAPETQVQAQTNNDTLLARRKYLQTSGSGIDLESVLAQYKEAVRVSRIHLKPVFQDFDITKNGHVTKHQFLRVLNLLRVSTSEDIQQQILRRYMDKGNVDEVNYFDFCEDVDGGDALFGVGRDFNHSWDLYPKTDVAKTGICTVRTTPDDVNDTIARIRKAVVKNRIRISEFFRDFDKLRSGHITAT
jgi:Ca2+-binding EF-hand superfamily protein